MNKYRKIPNNIKSYKEVASKTFLKFKKEIKELEENLNFLLDCREKCIKNLQNYEDFFSDINVLNNFYIRKQSECKIIRNLIDITDEDIYERHRTVKYTLNLLFVYNIKIQKIKNEIKRRNESSVSFEEIKLIALKFFNEGADRVKKGEGNLYFPYLGQFIAKTLYDPSFINDKKYIVKQIRRRIDITATALKRLELVKEGKTPIVFFRNEEGDVIGNNQGVHFVVYNERDKFHYLKFINCNRETKMKLAISAVRMRDFQLFAKENPDIADKYDNKNR